MYVFYKTIISNINQFLKNELKLEIEVHVVTMGWDSHSVLEKIIYTFNTLICFNNAT